METTLPEDDDAYHSWAEVVLDRTLASSLPEELVHSLVRNRIAARLVTSLAEEEEFERSVVRMLESERATRVTDAVLASAVAQHVLRGLASSPALRDAIAMQTSGLAEDVAADVRASARRLDGSIERVLRRQGHAAPTPYAGAVTRTLAFAVDTLVTSFLFMSIIGVAALIGSLVGGLRPEWLVGVLLGSGWMLVTAAYLILFWSTTGQTPGMRLLHVRISREDGAQISAVRSLLRVIGLVLSIIPMFAGFVPVLFTQRRRGCADWIAGSIVVYDAASPARGDALRDHAQPTGSSVAPTT